MFSFIFFSWYMSLGIVPLQADCVKGNTAEISTMGTMAELGVSATLFDRLTVGGAIENYQTPRGDIYFSPYRVDYKFFASLRIVDGLTLNATHECDHPVVFHSNGNITYDYLSNNTKIFIKFEGSTR